jgi:hypothetical protein
MFGMPLAYCVCHFSCRFSDIGHSFWNFIFTVSQSKCAIKKTIGVENRHYVASRYSCCVSCHSNNDAPVYLLLLFPQVTRQISLKSDKNVTVLPSRRLWSSVPALLFIVHSLPTTRHKTYACCTLRSALISLFKWTQRALSSAASVQFVIHLQ